MIDECNARGREVGQRTSRGHPGEPRLKRRRLPGAPLGRLGMHAWLHGCEAIDCLQPPGCSRCVQRPAAVEGGAGAGAGAGARGWGESALL